MKRSRRRAVEHRPGAVPGDETAYWIDASDRERVEAASGTGAAAYGEILPESARRLLAWVRLTEQDCFYDLGSGAGNLILEAATNTEAGRAVGIELSVKRHELAQRARAAWLASIPIPAERERHAERASFVHGDILEEPLDEATVVYMGSTCFPDALMTRLAARLATAPRLRLVMSTKAFPVSASARFQHVGGVVLPMTWADKVEVAILRPRRNG